MTKSNATPIERPLSPHLQIYKPQITSTLSILHRITGVALGLGLVIFVLWLLALASGPSSYVEFINCAHSVIGQIILVGISAAFYYHLCNGIRHLFWDAGVGLEIREVYASGKITLLAATLFTAGLWLTVWGII